MEMKLAENIRRFRKERSLTQEQLAEVTAGAVYKWEAGLSVPDLELWKAHNADGVYSPRIGHILAESDHAAEAVPFLSEALVKLLSDLVSTVIGYMNVYLKRGDHASAQAILSWGGRAPAGPAESGQTELL